MALPSAASQVIGTTATSGGFWYVVASVMGLNVWRRTTTLSPTGDVLEQVSVTGLNTLANFVNTQTEPMVLWVNGEAFYEPNGAFTVAGQAITWNPSVAGFDLEVSDTVFIDVG